MLKLIKKLRPEEIIAIFFMIVLIIQAVILGHRITTGKGTVQRQFWTLLFLAVVIWATQTKRRAMFAIRDGAPFIGATLAYENLHDLVHFINPHDQDNLLIKIDYWIFGLHPIVWMERFISPTWVSILSFAYGLYYLFPPILALILYLQKDYKNFRNTMMGIIIGFYMGYFGYLLVPAVGPRYIQADLFSVSLEGGNLDKGFRDTLDILESTKRDCFPSLHTAISVIALLFAYKYKKIAFYIFLVPCILLVASTMYLRYHYVIDVIAGLVLAVFCFWVGPKLNEWWDKHVQVIDLSSEGQREIERIGKRKFQNTSSDSLSKNP